tara:strand:+ start:135 stop:545 length:411 start_codon:yes stop_codon:yes gene_type:complete
MENKLKFRHLLEDDHKTICKWWKWWRWPEIPKEMLPDDGKSGFMVEKNGVPIVSCFLFITNSKGAKLEWIVSNPEYKEKDRKKAIEMLIDGVEIICKNMGCEYIFSIGRNKHLMETHKKLGWIVDKTPSYEIIKKI